MTTEPARWALEPPRSWLADARGTVLLLGLVFAVLLVGAGFHVASTGHAIIWREWAQDGADQAAYEASLWNARGMNVVVAINIFMAVVMAVLILWRMLWAFVIAATALAATACALSVISFGSTVALCAALPLLLNLNLQMARIDQRVVKAVAKIEEILHQAQVVVATATPLISASASAVSTQVNFGVVGIGLSTTLVPSIPARTPSSRACRRATEGTAPALGERLGKVVSLPVEPSEDYQELCKRGGTMIGRLINVVLDQTPVGGNAVVEKIFASVAGKGAMWFCGKNPISVTQDLVEEGVGNAGNQAADFCSQANAKANAGLCQTTSCDDPKLKDLKGDAADIQQFITDDPNDPSLVVIDSQKCREFFEKKFEQRRKNSRDQTLDMDEPVAIWADVWQNAANGNIYLQSWGVTFPDRPVKAFYDGITLPRGLATEAPNEIQLDSFAVAVAQAELFFDCDGAWHDDFCLPVAPWTMNWRARSRRMWDPMAMAQNMAETAIVDSFLDAANRLAPPAGFDAAISRLSALASFTDAPDPAADAALGRLGTRPDSAAHWANGELQSQRRNRMVH